jgi:hypothetical protein
MNDYAFLAAVLWGIGGLHFGSRVYRRLGASIPWPWFQGHTRGRAVVLSVAVGVSWPVALVAKEFLSVPWVWRVACAITGPRPHKDAG